LEPLSTQEAVDVERALSTIESTTGQGLASACWPGTDCHDDITSTEDYSRIPQLNF